jgi:hypothetical protein
MAKIFIILLLLSGLSFSVFSQGTDIAVANASASATIVEPSSITGNLAIIIAGTVVLTPSMAHEKSGSLYLPFATGTFTAASFYIPGSEGSTLTVHVPSSPLIIRHGSITMKVTSFNSDPALNESPDMIAGVYVSVTPLYVTINYN